MATAYEAYGAGVSGLSDIGPSTITSSRTTGRGVVAAGIVEMLGIGEP